MESDFNNSSNQDRRVDRVLLALCKEYVVVGKTRVKARHAWLVIGLVAGIAAGVILVANRSGEVEEGRAATASAISVELDLPGYYPDFLRHPQKFFSGQPLKITAPAFPDQAAVTLSDVATEKRQSVSVKQLKGEPSKAKIARQTAFSFTPPVDLPSGRYRISFVAGGQTYGLELAINGLTAAEKNISGAITVSDLLQRIAIRYRTEICKSCYAEMVFTGDPANPQILFHTNSDLLSRSSDGGRTWQTDDVNNIVAYPYALMSRASDPKIMAIGGGSFLFVNDVIKCFGPDWPNCNAAIGGMLLKGGSQGNLAFSWIKEPSTPGIISFDYGKLAYDDSDQSIYVAALSWVASIQAWRPSLFISKDQGTTFQ